MTREKEQLCTKLQETETELKQKMYAFLLLYSLNIYIFFILGIRPVPGLMGSKRSRSSIVSIRKFFLLHLFSNLNFVISRGDEICSVKLHMIALWAKALIVQKNTAEAELEESREAA